MVVFSGLYIRQRFYEMFLITHILMAIFTIIGSWYHILLVFGTMGHLQQLIYPAIAIWSFDRGIRVLRMLKNGLRRAEVQELGDGQYLRVDFRNLRWSPTPGQHAYLYFPTVSPLKAFQNHPFSAIPSSMLHSYHSSPSSTPAQAPRSSSSSEPAPSDTPADIEKRLPATSTRILSNTSKCSSKTRDPAPGLTFFIRKSAGFTKLLHAHTSLLSLVDGPYHNNANTAILRCDRLVLVAGGIGVTALLPWAHAHPNAKFYWSLKEEARCLADELETALRGLAEREVRVGARFDVRALLEREAESGWGRIGVVVCGPGGLCDGVRAAVVESARRGGVRFELDVEAYSW